MGRLQLLTADDTPLTVPSNGTATLPTDASPAFQSDDNTGHRGTKRRVRIGVVFVEDAPSSTDFTLRIVDTVGGEEVAVGISEPAAVKPGAGNAQPAGVWRLTGPVPSSGFLRFVNETTSDHDIELAVSLWEDV